MATKPVPASPSQDRSVATRATLIDLAAELFAEQGYLQTSVRDIARRGAVTSGALYGRFRNKADLLVAAIAKQTSEELEDPGMAEAGRAGYVATLGHLARDYRARRRLRSLIVQGAVAARTEADTRDALGAELLGHLDAWVAGYETHRAALGIAEDVDLRAFVVYTWAAELGLGVLEAIGLDLPSPDAWAATSERLAQSIRRSIAAAPPPRRRRR